MADNSCLLKLAAVSGSRPPDLARRYRIYKGIGVAGVIALLLNYSGWLPQPYEGEQLSYELLAGSFVWIALLLAGGAFTAWGLFEFQDPPERGRTDLEDAG